MQLPYRRRTRGGTIFPVNPWFYYIQSASTQKHLHLFHSKEEQTAHQFQTDEELNRICLDKTLNHTPVVSPGVYIWCAYCSSGRPMGIQKQHHSAFYCPTCCIYLCVQCHDGTRKSCMTKWHSIQNPSNLGT